MEEEMGVGFRQRNVLIHEGKVYCHFATTFEPGGGFGRESWIMKERL